MLYSDNENDKADLRIKLNDLRIKLNDLEGEYSSLYQENQKLKEDLKVAREAANHNSKLVSEERMKNVAYMREGEAGAYRRIVMDIIEKLMDI